MQLRSLDRLIELQVCRLQRLMPQEARLSDLAHWFETNLERLQSEFEVERQAVLQ